MSQKNNAQEVLTETGFLPLQNIRIVSLATNLPGPVAMSRLSRLGAEIIKVEPPTGDPLLHYSPDWYRELSAGQEIITLDLKNVSERRKLDKLLENSDLLVTSMRLAALERLSLSQTALSLKFPRLLQIAIIGYSSISEDCPGHDLTYQALLGLVSPPQMPKTLLTDLAAAEQTVSAALTLLLARHQDLSKTYLEVSIEAVGEFFAAPLRFGLTAPGGLLGGGWAGYNLYQTAGGWIALAALETRFRDKLLVEFNLVEPDFESFKSIFLTRTAAEWEQWAKSKDIPLKALTEK